MIFSEAKAALDLLKQGAALLEEKPNPQLVTVFEELRAKLLALYESDIELRQQVRELQEKLELHDSVFFDKVKGAYFTGTPEAPTDGPFCASCYHSEKGLVPMMEEVVPLVRGGMPTRTVWTCVSCKNWINRQ